MWRIPRCMRLENKPELRRFFLKQRMEQPRAEKAAADRSISERLLASTVFADNACSVMYPRRMRSIRMVSCVRRLPRGKTFACRAASARQMWEPYRVVGQPAGCFGILEPDASAREVPPERIDLIVAPALACDRAESA